MKIVIEPWKADPTYVHVHEEGNLQIHSRSAEIAGQMTVDRAKCLGTISQMIVDRSDGPYLRDYHSCRDVCLMLDGCVDFSSATLVKEARGQLEDAGCESSALKDDDVVSFLAWYARELWVEAAREIDNPFDDKIVLKYDLLHTLNGFFPVTEVVI